MAHADDKPDTGPTWQSVAVAACVLLCGIFGWILTDSLYTNRADIAQIRATLDERAHLKHRIETLEGNARRLEERIIEKLDERITALEKTKR